MRLLSTFLLLNGMVCAAFAQTQLSPQNKSEAIGAGKNISPFVNLTKPACEPAPSGNPYLYVWLASGLSISGKNSVYVLSAGVMPFVSTRRTGSAFQPYPPK